MTQITAPYGFVPLARGVFLPPWLSHRDGVAPPLHDVPFEKGICGHLTLEIEAETPIFVRGTEQPDLPFQLKDGRYAIPGTALRGALRNLVEILTFSKFQRVNNHRYAVRDLQNRQLYGDHMAAILKNAKTGKQEPMPLVNAGWLSKKGDEDDPRYEIEVCDFGKLEYRELTSVAQQQGVRNFNPGTKQSSVQKYKTWGTASLAVKVNLEPRRRRENSKLLSEYGVAQVRGGQKPGTIVMTGQPSNWRPDNTGKRAGAGNPKHHDFVFVPAQTKISLEVSPQTFEDFEFGHSNRGQQNKLGESQTPNEEWGYWKEKLAKGERVPVFFLTDESGKKVASFGLAMMFRLPYKHSIREAIGKHSHEHLVNEQLDFAEGLFGAAPQGRDKEDKGLHLKGRVGISHAFALGSPKPLNEVSVILGSPKASYYPNYVEQDPNCPGSQPRVGQNGRATYKTWMDADGAPRGWKRYRALKETYRPEPPTGADGRPLDASKVGTKFRPLPQGTKFHAHVDVHNLLPEELGALLWAIEWGGDDKARHMLGMARPLGYGRSRLRVLSSALYQMDLKAPDLQKCRQAFEVLMEEQAKKLGLPGWKNSPQIKEFLALAQPVPVDQARYQRLDPGRRVNEFVDAKKAGLALPSAVQHPRSAGGAAVRSGPAPTSGGFSSRPVASTGTVAQGATVEGIVKKEKTAEGGARVQVGSEEGILHPSSTLPPDLNEGATHLFTIMATGKPLMLKYLDPNAPPPPPPKQNPKGGPGHRPGGFRR